MTRQIKKDTTDVITYFVLRDTVDGAGKTGLIITDIDLTYIRDQAAAVKNDATALSAATDAHADNKGFEVDATNCPGLYRLDWPDAAFSAGANAVQLCVKCAGAFTEFLEVELVDYDPNDAQRLGLASLPNVNPAASGGIITYGTGNGQLNASSGGVSGMANATTQTLLMALMGRNRRIDQITRTGGKITAYRLRLYANAADAAAEQNELLTINATGTYAAGLLTDETEIES